MSEQTILKQVFEHVKENSSDIKTQKDFGDALGVTYGWLNTLLGRSNQLPKEVMHKLNNVFGIDLGWLISNGSEGQMIKGVTKEVGTPLPKGLSKDELINELMNRLKAAQDALRVSQENEKRLVIALERTNSVNAELLLLNKK